ncbi:hypothetical protein XELAEV_18046395mg [Xenopus laevis]|uniref:Uncharacterized protein n=1 Tax=Xenopus laevis TaxID=8355 RepID=A0A974H0V2_XENLA|nr:hypothetical protein XELAEV_18046395mg [Xenopus laevis]
MELPRAGPACRLCSTLLRKRRLRWICKHAKRRRAPRGYGPWCNCTLCIPGSSATVSSPLRLILYPVEPTGK